jgi:hypothetical protein
MDSLFIAITVGITMFAVVIFTTVALRRKASRAIELDFRNVFLTTSKEGQEALIKHWMDRTRCGRSEAMRLAVDEWRREQRSWR